MEIYLIFSESSEPVEPRSDVYNSDSSLDGAEEKLRFSIETKFVSILPYHFEQVPRRKNYAGDAPSDTAHGNSESAEKTAAESVSVAPIKEILQAIFSSIPAPTLKIS